MKKVGLLFLLAAMHLFALDGEKGGITGRVIDKITKQPLPGVTVMVLGTKYGAITGLEGKFVINNLPEDVYKLSASMVGYVQHIQTDVRVIRNKTIDLPDIDLIETSVQLDSAVVSAGKFTTDDFSFVSNYNYNREEIRRSPGAAGDIFRAIETIPGVSSSGGEFSSFSVRGGSPRDNLIIIDNIPFDKVAHFDGGTEEQEAQGGRFSIFASGLIDEANFQAGGFGSRFGGKSASAIELSLKEGNKSDYRLDATADIIGYEVNYDGKSFFDKNTGILLSVRHQDFKKILELTDQKDLLWPYYTDIIFKSVTDITPSHKLSLLALYADDHYERTLDNVYAAKTKADYDAMLAAGSERKTLFGLNYRWLTGTNSYWQNTLYYRTNRNSGAAGKAYIYGPNSDIVPQKNAAVSGDVQLYREDEDQSGYRTNFTWSFGAGNTLSLGGEYSNRKLNYYQNLNQADTIYIFDKNDSRPDMSKYYFIMNPAMYNYKLDDTRNNAAVYADATYRIGSRVAINPGVRYEYNSFNKKNYISPRFAARYWVSSDASINFAAGTYYQPIELRRASIAASNKLASDERSDHYILGYTQYLTDDWKLSAETYYKKFSDMLVMSDRATRIYRNIGTGYATGIDLGLIKRFVDKWYGQINYSYSVSKMKDNDGTPEYNSDFNQPHVFNILVGYEFDKELSFSAKWKYATGRPKDSFVTHADVFNNPAYVRYAKEITGNNDERLSNFHTFNIRVDYRKQFDALAIVAFVDILNIYNHLNTNEERFLPLSGTVSEKGFKMVPTIGVKVEF